MRIATHAAAAVFVVAIAAAQTPAPGLDGTWRGTLGGALRLVLTIEKQADGGFTGIIDSVDQGTRIPISRIMLAGDTVRLDVKDVNGSYEGTLNATRTEIKGTWNQGVPQPLMFRRDVKTAASPPAAPAASADTPVTAATFPLGLPLDLHVPLPPTPFLGGDGKTYLVYELYIANMSPRDLRLGRVEVLDGSRTIAGYDGGDLTSLLAFRVGVDDRRIIPTGRRFAAAAGSRPTDPAANQDTGGR